MRFATFLLLPLLFLHAVACADVSPKNATAQESAKPPETVAPQDNLKLPEDWAKGAVYYKMTEDPHKAAERGNPISQDRLGQMYEGGGSLERNEAEAIKWYKKAAAQGIQHSQEALARLYSDGSGIEPDYGESYFWHLVSDPALYKSVQHLTPEQRQVIEKRAMDWNSTHKSVPKSGTFPFFFDVQDKKDANPEHQKLKSSE